MSVNTVGERQATMELGVVTINNQRYVAILHFMTDEGQNRQITHEMVSTKSVALKLFNDVVGPYNEGSVLAHVSSGGFSSGDTIIKTHETLNTKVAWNKFISHLKYPQMDGAEPPDLALLDGINKIEFARELCDKIYNASNANSSFPSLNDQEQAFLRTRDLYKFPKLLSRQYDLNELSILQALAPDQTMRAARANLQTLDSD